MSRTKKFVSNVISSLFYRIVLFGSALIIPRLMIKTYGSEINGLVASASQFIRYFSLVEAGLAGASVFALYKPLANKDFVAISAVVSATTKFYFKSGYIFVGLMLCCSLVYPYFINVDSLPKFQVSLLIIILGCSGILNFFIMAKYRALITADQKIYIINYLNIVSVILNTAIIIVLTNIGSNIVVLKGCALLSVFVPPIVMHFYVKKHYGFVNYKAKPDYQALNKRWDALFLQILGIVQTSTPVVLATVFTDLKQVSVFAIYNMVIIGITQVMSIFGTGLSASFGELIANGDKEKLKETYNEYEFMTYSIITFFFSCAFVLLLPFVRLYTYGITDVNYDRPLLGFLFVLNAFFYSIKNPQGTLVTSAGLFRETRYQTLSQSLIAIVLGVIFAKYWGIVGILIALLVSNVYRDIDLIIFIPRKLENTSSLITFRRLGIKIIEFALICVPFFFIDMSVDNIFDWILWAMIVSFYSLIVITLVSILTDRRSFTSAVVRLTGIILGMTLWLTPKKKKTAVDVGLVKNHVQSKQ